MNTVFVKRGGRVLPNINWNYFTMRPTEININDAWPVLPLGWQISDDALKAMAISIEGQHREIDTILTVFQKDQKML